MKNQQISIYAISQDDPIHPGLQFGIRHIPPTLLDKERKAIRPATLRAVACPSIFLVEPDAGYRRR